MRSRVGEMFRRWMTPIRSAVVPSARWRPTRESARRPRHIVFFVTPYLLAILGSLTALSAASYVVAVGRARASIEFTRLTQRTQDSIQTELDLYAAVLRSIGALFLAEAQVTPGYFHDYASSLRLQQRYPGIQAVGFSDHLRDGPAALASKPHLASIQPWRDGPGSQHDAVIYVESPYTSKRQILGYDLRSNPVIAETLDRARDTGEPAACGQIRLLTDPGIVGFAMFTPVYSGQVPATVEQRRAHLEGYAFITLRISDMMAGVLRRVELGDIELDLFSSETPSPQSRLIELAPSEEEAEAPQRDCAFVSSGHLTVGGQTWTAVFRSGEEFERSHSHTLAAWGVAIGVMAVTAVLVWLTREQASARIRAEDIAEDLRQSEESLRISEERYRLASAASNDVILDWDLERDRIVWSDALHTALGYSAERMRTAGQWWKDRVDPAQREAVVGSFEEALRGAATKWTHEYRFSRAGGGTADVLDRRFIVRDAAGHAVRVIGAMLDMTERNAAEQKLKALNETLEQRVAQRTASLLTYQQRLRSLAAELTISEQRERRRLSQILHDHLQQLLVAGLMRVGMLEHRTQDPESVASLRQVAELLNESVEAARSLTVELSPPMLYERGLIPALDLLRRKVLEKYGLKIELRADPAAEPAAEDIRVLLFQAARELLFNVVKHARTEAATMTLHRIGSRVRMIVEDRGPGFDPQRLTSAQPAGGFGLFSMRERLQMIGGSLAVHSAPGKGTRITIEAPVGISPSTPESAESTARQLASPAAPISAVATAAATDADDAAPAAAAAGASDKAIRVLLADDHKMLREGLATLLSHEADIHVVAQAADGLAAVELAHRTRPHVVVMDVTMPRLSGIEATRRLRRELPEVRVIGLSMHDDQNMMAAMREAGAAAYVAKGSPSEALIAAIRGN